MWISAVLVVVLDLLSKHLVLNRMVSVEGQSAVIFNNLLRFTHHKNYGVVFGALSGYWMFIIGITAFLIIAIIFLAYSCNDDSAPMWAFGLVTGGAAGNLYDRFAIGAVRDFIDIRNPWSGENLWPVFNIADIGIVVGVVVLIAWHFMFPQKQEAQK